MNGSLTNYELQNESNLISSKLCMVKWIPIFNKSKLQLLRKENFKVVNRENESKYLIKET